MSSPSSSLYGYNNYVIFVSLTNLIAKVQLTTPHIQWTSTSSCVVFPFPLIGIPFSSHKLLCKSYTKTYDFIMYMDLLPLLNYHSSFLTLIPLVLETHAAFTHHLSTCFLNFVFEIQVIIRPHTDVSWKCFSSRRSTSPSITVNTASASCLLVTDFHRFMSPLLIFLIKWSGYVGCLLLLATLSGYVD